MQSRKTFIRNLSLQKTSWIIVIIFWKTNNFYNLKACCKVDFF
jgi:hypothetical protein